MLSAGNGQWGFVLYTAETNTSCGYNQLSLHAQWSLKMLQLAFHWEAMCSYCAATRRFTVREASLSSIIDRQTRPITIISDVAQQPVMLKKISTVSQC